MHILFVLLACWLLVGCQPSYEFQPIEIGTDQVRPPRPRTDGQLVRALYADLLGRPPTRYDFTVLGPRGEELSRFPIDEEQVLTDLFEGLSDPTPLRGLIAAGLVGSEELRLPKKAAVRDPAAYITEQFLLFFGRRPGVYELAAFVEAWRADPVVGPAIVLRALIGFREYQSF